MSDTRRLLIIGKVWPEPTSSAAGTRMMQLIEFFNRLNYTITFCSTAKRSEYSANLDSLEIESVEIELNNSSFDEFIISLKPDVFLFDRFMTEEQFGWRVAENCPDSVRILDSEDLHFLRYAREYSVKQNQIAQKAYLFTDVAKREVASILRCDLTLIISEYEYHLLKEQFGIPASILHELPLKAPPKTDTEIQELPDFDEREGFISIGNFLHKPNIDSVHYLKSTIWPGIRKQILKAELHIYGAYPPASILQLHSDKDGFFIHGRVENAINELKNRKVLLAPLRFGAGQKGKLLDAMLAGTPSITSSIGAEGMVEDHHNWPGLIEDSDEEFVQKACTLYLNQNDWKSAQRKIPKLINKRFSSEEPWNLLEENLNKLHGNLSNHRNEHFIGQILLHHQHASTKFMSKWIEEKNKS